MLWTLLVHNNTWHVSLGPKMAVLGVRSVIVCVLSVVLAWDGLCILFGPAQISRLLAGGFVCLSGPRWSTFDADHDTALRFGFILTLGHPTTFKFWPNGPLHTLKKSPVGIKPRPTKMTSLDSSSLQLSDSIFDIVDPQSRRTDMDTKQKSVKCRKRPKS